MQGWNEVFSLTGMDDEYLGQVIVALPKPPSEGVGRWFRYQLIRLRCLLTGKGLSKCAEEGCPNPPRREWSSLINGVFCTLHASPEQSHLRLQRLMARDHLDSYSSVGRPAA